MHSNCKKECVEIQELPSDTEDMCPHPFPSHPIPKKEAEEGCIQGGPLKTPPGAKISRLDMNQLPNAFTPTLNGQFFI